MTRPGASMDSLFSTWDVLLQTIADSHPPFLTTLTEEMAMDLGRSGCEAETETAFLWLRHILESSTWAPQRPRIPISYLRAICREMPNDWTTRLETQALSSFSASTAVDDAAVADPAVNLDVYVDDGWDVLEAHGWGSARNWTVRPIGVV